MTIDVLGHRILIKPERLEDVDKVLRSAKAMGIEVITEEGERAQASVDRGIVIQVGQSAFKDFGTVPWCVAGDYVAYARYAGKVMSDPYTDEEFLIINDEDVVCRFIKEKV
jgi:co-chaperonin GroES (HSP10)